MNLEFDLDSVILRVGIFKIVLRRTITRILSKVFRILESFGTKQEQFVIRFSIFWNIDSERIVETGPGYEIVVYRI